MSSYGTVKLVISDGKLKFETREVEIADQKKIAKEEGKAANRKHPRSLNVKRDRKRDLLMQKRESSTSLSGYEVPKAQGPEVRPHKLTGEERFFLKKVAQKKSNYVPIARRGVFGGVILNMHMHWKKHETVKVICKPCKPGQDRFMSLLRRLQD
ncbi:unnamed protein product [Linum tenue]|uniref:CRM domain-containing protein n=1 Tax=Linum tenue TaxID=586396 RepID=A0AAV0KVR3_9ROSI|nr:unnamed protein product [Linum tenue]